MKIHKRSTSNVTKISQDFCVGDILSYKGSTFTCKIKGLHIKGVWWAKIMWMPSDESQVNSHTGIIVGDKNWGLATPNMLDTVERLRHEYILKYHF